MIHVLVYVRQFTFALFVDRFGLRVLMWRGVCVQMSVMWGFGLIIGPAVGGYLSQVINVRKHTRWNFKCLI